MMNKGVAIKYGDVAPEAKENFEPIASETKFGEQYKSELKQYNLNFANYANPCELYQTVLDGTASAFPSAPEKTNLGLWSEQMSNVDGSFTNPIVLELESEGQYTSQGLTLTFDTYNDIYASRLHVKWLRITDEGITELAEDTYEPDKASYFCRKQVENYNKVIITFYSLNMPHNRLKLRVVDYGYGTIFYGSELRGTKITQELDPLSTQISINVADFTIDSKSDMEYSFQTKQPLSIYFNGDLKATTFVKSSKRKSKFLWEVQSEDYIGLMDSVPYYGGIYTDANAVDILKDIFSVSKVPYDISEIFSGMKVSGHIPYTTCRDALMQVAFAIQAVVDTSNSDAVKVFALEDDIKQRIPLERIKQGQNFTDDEVVTGVEVTLHTYKEADEDTEVYDASESGIGDEIFVQFSEPLHSLSISNGEILSHGANYAIINAREGCVLSGKNYEHTTQIRRKNRPDVGATTFEKIVAVSNATLISQNNIAAILEKSFDWLIKTNSTSMKINEGKHVKYGQKIRYGEVKYGEVKYGEKTPNVITYDTPVNLGENIEAETEYLGIASGRIIKQSFNLNGNILVKDVILK